MTKSLVFIVTLCALCVSPFVKAAEISSESILATPMEDITNINVAKKNLAEVGVMLSSINGGSTFTGIGLMRELGDSFAIGVRGCLPLPYSQDLQTFMGQGVARLMLLNTENTIFLDGILTQAFVSGAGETQPYAAVGMSAGYRRYVAPDLSIGLSVGAEYAAATVSKDRFVSSNTFNSVSNVSLSYNY